MLEIKSNNGQQNVLDKVLRVATGNGADSKPDAGAPDEPILSKETLRSVAPLFGSLGANADLPFISHNAEKIVSSPVPDQFLKTYEVFLGSYIRAMTVEHTRRERTFILPLDTSGVGSGVITYFDADFTALPASFQSAGLIGSLDFGAYQGGQHSASIAIPFIDLRLGDSLVDDIANSIVTIRVRGSLLSDDPDKRNSALVSHSFDTRSVIFVPSEADFKVRIYPYVLKGSKPYYVPLELTTAAIPGKESSSIEIDVTGVTGLVSVTIPTVHGRTLQDFGAAVEASLLL